MDCSEQCVPDRGNRQATKGWTAHTPRDPTPSVSRGKLTPPDSITLRGPMATAHPTSIPDVVLVQPEVHGDSRGFLLETFSELDWREFGIEGPFVQENHSRSTARGTLRGMHFQTSPGQAKLVRCVRGAIFDVAVDLRRGSRTYGTWVGHVLDDETHHQLWVPVGFAHGFQVLSEVADVAYKLTSLYDSKTESEIAWDDPDIAIEWPIHEPVLSERDKVAPRLAEVADSLPFGR